MRCVTYLPATFWKKPSMALEVSLSPSRDAALAHDPPRHRGEHVGRGPEHDEHAVVGDEGVLDHQSIIVATGRPGQAASCPRMNGVRQRRRDSPATGFGVRPFHITFSGNVM